MLLVVGLGNPGREYENHRHNVGFMAVEALADALGADPFREKFDGRIAKATIKGQPLWLLLPQTFMNRSGDAVQPAAAFFKIAPENVLVVHDELDIPFGEVRLKQGGGHAGHNGLRNVTDRLGTAAFGRIRIGIGRPPPEWDVKSFVLANFLEQERQLLPDSLLRAGKSVVEVALRGYPAAMKTVNTRPKAKKTPKVETSTVPRSAAKRPGATDREESE